LAWTTKSGNAKEYAEKDGDPSGGGCWSLQSDQSDEVRHESTAVIINAHFSTMPAQQSYG